MKNYLTQKQLKKHGITTGASLDLFATSLVSGRYLKGGIKTVQKFSTTGDGDTCIHFTGDNKRYMAWIADNSTIALQAITSSKKRFYMAL